MNLLQQIQTELHAPKGQRNNFGKYSYRSCEDILTAVKPILAKHRLSIVITDDIAMIGNRFYVKATSSIFDENRNIIAESSAFAREPEVKKGMDESQITGAASSYARKYSLNGLLAIDDTKDADTNEYATKAQHIQQNPSPTKPAPGMVSIFNSLLSSTAASLTESITNQKVLIDAYMAECHEYANKIGKPFNNIADCDPSVFGKISDKNNIQSKMKSELEALLYGRMP